LGEISETISERVMIYEKSAGAVLFYDGARREYLLLHYNEGHWDFPKGHIEGSETEEQTCRREVKEETAIGNIEIFPGFRHVYGYNYRRKGQLYHKDVTFFVAKTTTREVKLSVEHKGFVWLSYDDAVKKATFDNGKELLRRAKDFLSLQGF